jgi:ABC-2 type transport system permease protein
VGDWFLFRAALRDLVRPKRLLAALVLGGAPGVLAAIWRATARGEFPAEVVYNALAGSLVFGFVLVILSVVFGTGVIAQEIEQKTIVYLLMRPVPRWRIALVRLLAAVTGITLTLWLSTGLLALVTVGPGAFAGARVGRDFLILPLAALAYTSVFLLVSTLSNKPLLWGLSYAFGWESWASTLPGHFQKLSLMAYLRVLSPHPQPEGESMDISTLLMALNPKTITPTFAGRVLAGVIVVALLVALVVFSTREYVPREDTD